MASEPKHDFPTDYKSATKESLALMLLQMLEGNITSAEQLERLATTFLKLARQMTICCALLLLGLVFFTLGQVCYLIAALIRAGIIG